MIMIDLEQQSERKKFAFRAAKAFEKNKELLTFTDAHITEGCLFALRWGLGRDCVVVFKLDENEPVENYTQIINKT